MAVGSTLLTTLLIGLLTAYAFQLVLACFGFALGITVLGFQRSPSTTALEQDGGAEYSPKKSAYAGFWVGMGLLLSANGVLFSACFLATKFSQLSDPIMGAIAGIVIWSAYGLSLAWISSVAVGTLMDAILGVATGGLRQLTAAIAAAFQNQNDTPLSQEEIVEIVQQEIQQALSPVALNLLSERPVGDRSNQTEGDSSLELSTPAAEDVNLHLKQELELYLRHARSKQLTPDRVRHKLNELLEEVLETSALSADQLDLDQTQLKSVLKEREALNKRQRQKILQAIAISWQQLITSSDAAFSKDSQPEEKQPSSEAFQAITAYITEAVHKLDNQLLDPDVEPETMLQQHVSEGLSFSTAATLVVLHQLSQIDWDALLDRLPLDSITDRPIEQLVSNVRSTAQDLINQPQQWTEDYVLPQTQALKNQVMQQAEQFEQGLQARINTVKAQAQKRLSNTRKAAAIAAWWLSITAFTTAVSAAIAGALAAGMPVPML